MKKVSIVIPTYNEEENIKPITDAVIDEIETFLPEYTYEILIIDNNSQDKTRTIIRAICRENKLVKAILTRRILARIVRHIMDCFRQAVTVQYFFAQIFKIR